MKRIMMMVVMALTLGTTYAFTGEEPISNRALEAFRTEFNGATEVSWAAGTDSYKVTFTLNDQKLFAFYTTDGEFIAVTRYISSIQLPLNLQTNLKKMSGKYWITDLFELSDRDGTSYYLTLENADTKIVLRSTAGNDWSLYEKNKK